MRPFSFLSWLVFTIPLAAQEATRPDFTALSDRFEKAADALGVPGFAVVVVKGDEVLHQQTYGVRDCAGDKPVTDRSAFYIASCTKTFVATAILMLVERGELTLDDPVQEHLERFELADREASRAITVRDLLSHAPGIDSEGIVFLDAYSGEITEDRYYRFLRQVEPTGTPTYTNVHFTLAGRVVEAVSGKPWRRFLQSELLEPLGLLDTTGFADAMYARDDVAVPMQASSGGFEHTAVRKSDRTMHAAGGLGTSVRDLGRWLRFHLSGGKTADGERLLDAATVREMQALAARLDEPIGRAPLPVRDGFGLGWIHGTLKGKRYLQHGGGYVGSAALVSLMPDEGIGVGIVANAGGGGQGLVQLMEIEIYDLLLGHDTMDLLPILRAQIEKFEKRTRDARPTGANPVDGGLSLRPAGYVGRYVHRDWGAVEVQLTDDGELMFTLGTLRASLHTSGQDAFIAEMGTGRASPGRFLVADGACIGVSLDLAGESGIRFERE